MQRQLLAWGVVAGAVIAGLGLAVGFSLGRVTAPTFESRTQAPQPVVPTEKPIAVADERAETRKWSEKPAQEIAEQEAIERGQQLEQIYVTQALTRLTRREGGLIEFIDPPLDPDKMVKGDVGTFAIIRVLQVIDGNTFLATVDDGQTVIIAGMNTAQLVDGREFRGRQLAFEVLGPLSYENLFGAKKTVMTVRHVDVEDARQKAREAVRAEIKRMRGE